MHRSMEDGLPEHARPQSLGEEIANSISHGLGALAAVVAAPILIGTAGQRGDRADTIAVTLFAATMVLLYLTSTLYHALPRNKAKHLFRVFDHSAIYLLIAGTYTPFTLGVLRGAWGWTLFGLIWSLALFGIVLKAVHGFRHPRLSTALYLGMGWLAIIAARPLLLHVPPAGVLWLAAGGLAYTAGVGFFAADHRLRYAHFVWHLFVLTGTCCHFFAVLWYSA